MKVSFEAAPAFCIIDDVTVDRYDRFKMDARVWMHRVAALQRKVLQTLRKGNVLRGGIDTSASGSMVSATKAGSCGVSAQYSHLVGKNR